MAAGEIEGIVMTIPALLLLGVSGIALAGALTRFTVGYLRLRGRRLVTCPESEQPAAVELAAGPLALSATFGPPHLRLKDCTRWPEHLGCDQACLAQIESAPAGCLVVSLLEQWYQGKVCQLCGRPFGDIELWDHHPALLDPEGRTWEWSEIPAEELPRILASHAPVCWDCHIVALVYRHHPDFVVERPQGWHKMGSLYH